MSKSNYYKERVIQLLLFFAFMLPMGAWAQNIQLNRYRNRCNRRNRNRCQCIRERYNERSDH